MSYIFMKILERRPATYEAGISKYAAGDFSRVRDQMLSLVGPGDRVLDVGCGPGTFAVECAKRGALVEAVDINPQMLYVADLAAKKAGVESKITFRHSPATAIEAEHESFDLVVFSLSMSELREVEHYIALNSAFDFLKPGGKLVLADEVVPRSFGSRVWYHFRRMPLLAITYLMTGTTTKPVREPEEKLRACGFEIERAETYEHGSLKFVVGNRMDWRPSPVVFSADRLPRWEETAGAIFSYLTLAFKSVPVQIGLYKFGNPKSESPLLVTANYLLTFSSVKRHLRGLDCYLLVIDTRGINVWCSAAKGNFSAEEIHNTLRATRAAEVLDSRKLILPKLSAAGVRYRDVKKLTGWEAVIGPVYARDIPEFLDSGWVKSESMKQVRFDLVERLRLAPPFALFIAFWFLLPILFFHNLYSPKVPLIALAAGLIFPPAFYILPSDLFFKKGLTLGLVGAVAAAIYLLGMGAHFRHIVLWGITIVGITTFVAMDFSGMSPVSNYSRVKQEYLVAVVIIGLTIVSNFVLRFVWR